MDNLEDLPEAEYSQSPGEQQVMSRFFEDTKGERAAKDKSGSKKETVTSRINLKKVSACVIAFIIAANPWIDGILDKIPYAQGQISKFGIKTLLFTVLILLIMVFL